MTREFRQRGYTENIVSRNVAQANDEQSNSGPVVPSKKVAEADDLLLSGGKIFSELQSASLDYLCVISAFLCASAVYFTFALSSRQRRRETQRLRRGD